MNEKMSASQKTQLLKKRLKTRTIVLNTIAEFIASTIFSLLYFVFISRYLAEEYDINYIMLSFGIGLAFFAAIYIPFHTYRIHIIPFITLITALRKRKPIILLHKIPAQFLGAFLGVILFNVINAHTTRVNIENFQLIYLNDHLLLIAINSFAAALLCYMFYMIRVLFNSRQLTGTIYLSLFYAALFALTSVFANTSSLNPFGYFFYDLLGQQTINNTSFIEIIATHVLAPITAVALLFFYVKPLALNQSK
ncbi:MAG: hypothetical protein HND27_02085 [Bacteroidetes bacterium]|nr:hypothetical protein [Bacteroidota bacterium]MCL4815205.1 hypothetical protein [Flavobacteriales bacterium]NOG94547.1 hypothetical protein [Bacteroidota bacterium]WKZ75639.1 MAG: hypothetical protein QY303_01850 [Vicingaceae bacterium]GIK69157.1 MAG: hypothetical protein BroJett020_04520 [Bacteroidota bacterium]